MRVLFVIQGEGRGHLTQALALQADLHEAGHEVVGGVISHNGTSQWPSFFVEQFRAPLTPIESLSIVMDRHRRSVRPVATVMHALCRFAQRTSTLDLLQATIDTTRPDVIINFFEPAVSLLAQRRSLSVPVVAVAHQYMFLHPNYRFPPGQWLQRQAARSFTWFTGYEAVVRIALSLYPAPSHETLRVHPPLLRPIVRTQTPWSPPHGHLQVYLMNAGYARDVMHWHQAHPDVPLRCFWSRPGITRPEHVDDTLTIYPISQRPFVEGLAAARGLITTAGFESVAEAMYLNTPVQAVPVQSHYEHRCNAYDTVRAGAGIRSKTFDCSALWAFAQHHQTSFNAYREWVKQGAEQLIATIEQAAYGNAPVPL